MTAYNACPMPDPLGNETEAFKAMLRGKRVAVVGLSDDPSRASYGVAAYLREQGKEIIPVNPNCQQVMGLKCYASLEEVPGEIDVVNVFRRPEFCADVVRQAAKVKAGGVWLQSGIVSDEAMAEAAKAGLPFVQNKCLMVEHARRRE